MRGLIGNSARKRFPLTLKILHINGSHLKVKEGHLYKFGFQVCACQSFQMLVHYLRKDIGVFCIAGRSKSDSDQFSLHAHLARPILSVEMAD